MIVHPLVVGPLQTNCYIVADDDTREALIIDPGGDANRILDAVQQMKADVRLIVNTHGHFDHITANEQVMEATGAPLAIHPDDAGMLTNPLRSFSLFVARLHPSPPASIMLADGERLQVGSVSLKVLHTPGHSPGSVSLWCEEQKVVFSGDALFHLGIGRTDFPGASHELLLKSIREKLLTLPDDTVVYSGHGPQTTIGSEKLHNPWLA